MRFSFDLSGCRPCDHRRPTARIFVAVMALATIAGPAAAQVMVSPALTEEKPKQAEKRPKAKEFRFQAAAEPDPALQYRFWPAPEVRRQGNPIPFVSRAILLSVQAKNSPQLSQEFIQESERLNEVALDELSGDEVRKFLDKFGKTALRELERAENLTDLGYDLRLDELSTSELIATVLPEIQESRTLARLLALRARLAVAERRWADFSRDVRLGLRLSECAGRGNDFLIGRLVGYAIFSVMMGVVEEAIQQPESPNFYWALASMPEVRLTEIRDSIEFESAIVARMFNDVRNLPPTPISDEAARMMLLKLVAEAGKTLQTMNVPDGYRAAQMMAGVYVVTMADPSRDLLAETEAWGEKAYELSPAEAVLRGMQLKFDRSRDNWAKWALLPADAWDEYKERSKENTQFKGSADMVDILMEKLTPAVDAARRASQRTAQTRNLLLTIEAIRMHAESSGQLPDSLENLLPVPAWIDALTSKPFRYTRTSPTTATVLRTPRYPGDKESTIQIQLLKQDPIR